MHFICADIEPSGPALPSSTCVGAGDCMDDDEGLEQESHGELKSCAQAGTEGRCRDGNATAVLCTKTCGGCFAAAGAQPELLFADSAAQLGICAPACWPCAELQCCAPVCSYNSRQTPANWGSHLHAALQVFGCLYKYNAYIFFACPGQREPLPPMGQQQQPAATHAKMVTQL